MTTPSTEGLKPCPFCGGNAFFERHGDPGQSCIVVCGNCGCRHESSDEGFGNGASWNTRPSPPSAEVKETAPSLISESDKVREAAIRNALLIAKEALIDADIAIKGREHTGFIYKALAEIGVALRSTPAHASDAAQPVKGEKEPAAFYTHTKTHPRTYCWKEDDPDNWDEYLADRLRRGYKVYFIFTDSDRDPTHTPYKQYLP